jgi:hypothetical protein
MTQTGQHVLVWVAPQFLQSAGMLRILREAGLFSVPESNWDKLLDDTAEAGGFALGGLLVEAHHGAGIWIAPENTQGVQLMIPWQFVRSVVTAQEPEHTKAFGLLNRIAQASGGKSGAAEGTDVTQAPGSDAKRK